MIKIFFVTLMLLMVSLTGSAITIVNKSGIPVAFRIDGEVLHLESKESIELPESLQNKLSISYVGNGSGLLRFNKIGEENEVFFRTDFEERILFKRIFSGEKIGPLSSYKTMIIKNCHPEMYDGLVIEFQKTHQQEFRDLVNIGDWKCSIL